MARSRLCRDGMHGWCMNRSPDETHCTCDCHDSGKRPMVLDDLYGGVLYPLTLDGPNGSTSTSWRLREPEWCDRHRCGYCRGTGEYMNDPLGCICGAKS